MDLTPREEDKLTLADTALIIEVADDHTLRTGEGLTDAARRAIGYGPAARAPPRRPWSARTPTRAGSDRATIRRC